MSTQVCTLIFRTWIAGVLLCALPTLAHPQAPDPYPQLIAQADSLYDHGAYMAAAHRYGEAFALRKEGIEVFERLGAARAWAMADVPDSAFSQLFILADRAEIGDTLLVTRSSAFTALQNDPRWRSVIDRIHVEQARWETHYDRPLMAKLDSVRQLDQSCRERLDEAQRTLGRDAKEVEVLKNEALRIDSNNTAFMVKLLDERGWLGADVVGADGAMTLFLVIQHAPLHVQERYLPLMRQAVVDGTAQPFLLAMLEDRVAVGNGRRQLYGTQLGVDPGTGAYFVMPVDDPAHVDERRAAVGHGPLAEYLRPQGIQWDADAHQRELPALEERLRNRKP